MTRAPWTVPPQSAAALPTNAQTLAATWSDLHWRTFVGSLNLKWLGAPIKQMRLGFDASP